MDNKSNDNFINIFANTDERMKELGQILKTPKSLQIYQILMDRQLHTKEIGVILEKQDNPRLPNLTHHLKKMTKIGLLVSSTKMKNGHNLTYYKAVKYLLIVPAKNIEVAQKSKTLKSTMRKVFKICTISFATIISYILTNNHVSENSNSYDILGEITSNYFEFIVPMIVLAGAIGIERSLNFFNKRRSIKIERSFNN